MTKLLQQLYEAGPGMASAFRSDIEILLFLYVISTCPFGVHLRKSTCSMLTAGEIDLKGMRSEVISSIFH